MPITTDLRADERILIITMTGQVTAQEIETANVTAVKPFLEANLPDYVDVIWDVRELMLDFSSFIKILSYTRQRRSQEDMPMNIHQHFVGRNDWINNLRTWMQKNYDVDTSSFTSIENAINYITSAKR